MTSFIEYFLSKIAEIYDLDDAYMHIIFEDGTEAKYITTISINVVSREGNCVTYLIDSYIYQNIKKIKSVTIYAKNRLNNKYEPVFYVDNIDKPESAGKYVVDCYETVKICLEILTK